MNIFSRYTLQIESVCRYGLHGIHTGVALFHCYDGPMRWAEQMALFPFGAGKQSLKD